MNSSNQEVNAGVHANIGMDFQKNCAIYLFLESYNDLKDQRYFIIIEHLEDIIFGFLNNEAELSRIQTYQAKKSSSKWATNALLKIIHKITETGQSILDDPHPKAGDFFQDNHFATNNSIEFKCRVNSQSFTCTVNESSVTQRYVDLDQNIKDKLLRGNREVTFTQQSIANLDTIVFKFIDLGRTPKAQREQLEGMFRTVFGNRIEDHKAAYETLYYALAEIERKFNQGGVAKLADNRKRIESTTIEPIIGILTKKKLAFNFWREKGQGIREELNVSLYDSPAFDLHYQNSFDKFKDINESEHKKIFAFVAENKDLLREHTTDRACIIGFLRKFNDEKSSTLSDLQLKAAIAAAFVEVKNTEYEDDTLYQ
ncbi:hypothetical protein EDD80_11830 [Anseongella ginsenosidimutans]|uniref:CD-NTase associated protein 4-like DNA endonuclease domain-containing protein n=1 Tax=Anseongella ginsenosidimutans TaxID=496056 RepID=A0A4R3KLH0_9SPHI|nr:dsDNA nuclease domain-containing protein [Anseongella ginsenosidimutans]QEC51972.1 hypothetical protein FRZ59_06255 [Anseongella ginsenosidimutans]TCS84761.1 hypothetical protein EDD80_11830 [Anseongella ginsenosidimutans]